MQDCLFCRIASGAIPAPRLHEDARCIAIADIAPKAPVHLLVIPIEHIASASGVDEARVRVAADLARERGLEAGGYRLVLNHGPQAGQTVFHLHLHLLGGRDLGAMG